MKPEEKRVGRTMDAMRAVLSAVNHHLNSGFQAAGVWANEDMAHCPTVARITMQPNAEGDMQACVLFQDGTRQWFTHAGGTKVVAHDD